MTELSTLTGALFSDDTRYMAAALNQLEVAQDTFLAVRTLPIDMDASDFSESVFNMQGVQVWCCWVLFRAA